MYIPSVFFQVGDCQSLALSGSITGNTLQGDACKDLSLGNWYRQTDTNLEIGTQIFSNPCLSIPIRGNSTDWYRDVNFNLYILDDNGYIISQSICSFDTGSATIWLDTTDTGSYTTGSAVLYNLLDTAESSTWIVNSGVDIVDEQSIALTGSFTSNFGGAIYLSGSNLEPDPPGPGYFFGTGTNTMFMLVKSRPITTGSTGYDSTTGWFGFWNNAGDASGREGVNTIARGQIYDGDDQPSERTTFTYNGGVNQDSILNIDISGSAFSGWLDDYKVLVLQMTGSEGFSRNNMWMKTWHDDYQTNYYFSGSFLGSTRFNKIAQNFGYFKKFVYTNTENLSLQQIQRIAYILESDYKLIPTGSSGYLP